MLSSVLGTGYLSLPFRVQQLGIVPFIIVLILTNIQAFFGMYMIERVILKYKVETYSKMVNKAFGERIMRIAEIVLIVYPWALCICFQVVIAKFSVEVLTDLFGFNFY
jgi:amino acid permease